MDPNWKRTAYFDEGGFILNGKGMTAYYDTDAELAGTASPSDFSAIHKSARNSIRKHYRDYSVGKVILFDDNDANPSDMIMYGSAVSDEDNYFVELKKGHRTILLKVNMEGGTEKK